MKCTFNFIDGFNRQTQRSWWSTSTLLVDALTDIAALASAINALSDGGLDGVVITNVDTSEDFAAVAGSNVDDNASIQVLGGDGYKYDFNLPMPITALFNADGTVDTSNAALATLMGLFATGDNWRINLRNPTDIDSVVGGTLDK